MNVRKFPRRGNQFLHLYSINVTVKWFSAFFPTRQYTHFSLISMFNNKNRRELYISFQNTDQVVASGEMTFPDRHLPPSIPHHLAFRKDKMIDFSHRSVLL